MDAKYLFMLVEYDEITDLRFTLHCEICGTELDKPHYSFGGYPMTCDKCFAE